MDVMRYHRLLPSAPWPAKAVVRDVARVQGKSYGLADKLSKMIPFEVGMTLEKAVEEEESLQEF